MGRSIIFCPKSGAEQFPFNTLLKWIPLSPGAELLLTDDVVKHTYNPSTPEAKAERGQVQGQPGIQGDLGEEQRRMGWEKGDRNGKRGREKL